MALVPWDLTTERFETGAVIFSQGDAAAGNAYLIQEGSIKVTRQVNGETRILRTLGNGDLLGEVALFRDAPHSATAIALEPVTVLVIPADRLEAMVRARPELAIALIRQLARMAADADSTQSA
jgi:CRP/FNR family cyclic AMP-dependent transcriptional regulator